MAKLMLSKKKAFKLNMGEVPNGVLVKKTQLKETVILGGLVYAVLMLLILHTSAYMAYDYQITFFDALQLAGKALTSHPFQFVAAPKACGSYIFMATMLYALAALYMYAGYKKDLHMMSNASYGTAHWNTDLDAYNKRFTDPADKPSKDGNKNLILTEDVYMSMDGRKTRRNVNVFIIGGSGAGKSRFYIKPNLCQMPLNTSFVTTDPSGELLESCGQMLEDFGYKIKVLNLVNMKKSNTYNPLDYIHEENDVILLTDCLLKNTTDPNKSGGDDFWEKAMKLMLQAFIFALWLHGDEIGLPRSFDSVMKLMRGCTIDEEGSRSDSEALSDTDKLFNLIEFGYKEENGKIITGTRDTVDNPDYQHAYGEDISVRQYKNFKMGAGKTLKNILISAMARFSNFDSQQLIDLTSSNDIDLTMIGREKTALFVILPQEHDSFNFLAATMYSQLAQSLYFDAENNCQGNYLVCDADGEIIKIFEIDHSAELECASNRKADEKELEIDIQKDEIIPEKKSFKNLFENLFVKKRKCKNKADDKEELGEEELWNEKAEENEENTLPNDGPGRKNDNNIEEKAKKYIDTLKNVRLVQKGKKYLIKAQFGDVEEVIAEYGNKDFAIKKAKALRNCTIKRCGLCLPFNVRLMLDEFANIGEIPRFTNLLATMRKYNISACCVLQSISQIKKMYKDDWGSIIGNCDALLFLGCAEYETQEFISKKLGKTTIIVKNNSISKGGKSSSSMSYQHVARDLLTPDEVGQLTDQESILLIRGVAPFRGNKYEFTHHPNYKYTSDADPSRAYKIKVKAKDENIDHKKMSIMSYSETEEGRMLSESKRQSRMRSSYKSSRHYQMPPNKEKYNSSIEKVSSSTYQKKSDEKIQEALGMFTESAKFSKYSEVEKKKALDSFKATRLANLKDVEDVFVESTKIDPADFLTNFAESLPINTIDERAEKTSETEPKRERGNIDNINDSLPNVSSSTASF